MLPDGLTLRLTPRLVRLLPAHKSDKSPPVGHTGIVFGHRGRGKGGEEGKNKQAHDFLTT